MLVPNLAQPGQSAAETWVQIYHEIGDGQAIRNVQTDLRLETIGNEIVPATLNNSEYENSYVCSAFTAYISYAQDESHLLNHRLFERLVTFGIRLGAVWLKTIKINQTLSINNWLFSTNIPANWPADALQNATQRWTHQYPKHSISIRSLNPTHHSELMQTLKQQNWQLIPARQVYLFEGQPGGWWKRNNCKNDQRLFRKTPLKPFENESLTDADFIAIEHCFNQLFIEKHSIYNPQFSATYFQRLHQAGLVVFKGFRDQEGKIIGMVGFFTQQNIITTPILGYDTQLPKSLGLYRLLIALVLKHAHDLQQPMNLSSGAGDFKTLRGGEPTVEYTAYYVQHLPFGRRWGFKAFSALLNLTLPKLFAKQNF